MKKFLSKMVDVAELVVGCAFVLCVPVGMCWIVSSL